MIHANDSFECNFSLQSHFAKMPMTWKILSGKWFPLRDMRQRYLFESLLRLIRESLNDQPTHEFRQNVKLTDFTGAKREFDVVIESKINEFTASIIFESKDTRSPVNSNIVYNLKHQHAQVATVTKMISTIQKPRYHLTFVWM